MSWTPSPEPPADLRHHELGEPSQRWAIRDIEGRLFATHCRFDLPAAGELTEPRKTLRWFRDGRWSLTGMSSRDAPLYGSEMLRFLTVNPVYVVEGERAADAARTLGFIVLGTATGAAVPGPQALEVLRNRSVVLCPDKDDTGRTHMQGIVEALDGIAAEIRWLELPDLPPSGDFVEFVEAGGTADRVRELTEAAPSPRPEQGSVEAALSAFDVLDGLTPAEALDAVQKPLEGLAAALSGSTDLEHELARAKTVERLKTAGISAPTKIVDAALRRHAPAEVFDDLQGEPIDWDDPDPWPEPVDGASLLDEIRAILRRFIVLPPGADIAITLWILHTWALDAFSISPRLAILSPEKRCGKTTLLDVLEALVSRPLLASHTTTATLFRAMALYGPTILLDEGDRWINEHGQHKTVLNAGHRRQGTVVRTAGEDHEPRLFRVYGAVAVALIGDLYPELADRSVTVRMRRMLPQRPSSGSASTEWTGESSHVRRRRAGRPIMPTRSEPPTPTSRRRFRAPAHTTIGGPS